MAATQTQDRDQDVVAYQAFSGLRNDVSSERFSLGDLAVGDNIDVDKSGRIARRDGRTSARAGSAHSLWSWDGIVAFFVSGSTLYRLNADYSATALKTVTAGARMAYWQVNDSVFMSNGYERAEWRQGVLHSWGLPVPPLPGVSQMVGSLSAGAYQFSITWLRGDGQESGAPLAGLISVPDGAGLEFQLPTPTDPEITQTAIYLSLPNSETMYRALLVPSTFQYVAYQGDTSELNLPLVTQFMGPPPAGQQLCYYRGHMYVAVEDAIYPSEEFNYSLFDLRKYISLDGRITMLAPFEDKERAPQVSHNSGIFVGTDKQCGVLVGSAPDEMQYVQKTDYGAIPGALAFVDGNLFGDDSAASRKLPMFLTTQGICVGLQDMEIKNLTRTKYGFPAAGQGAAFFYPGPNRFVAVCNY